MSQAWSAARSVATSSWPRQSIGTSATGATPWATTRPDDDQASSTADWKQFFGSSPYQVGNFFYASYHSVAGAIEAFEALNRGDYDAAYWWFANSVFDALEADYWFDTTKYEVEGPTFVFNNIGHGALHEPPVWYAIAPYCS